MKVTYNEKTKKFCLIYRDPLKVARGDKHPYTRKQQSWKSPFPPRKEQKERIKQELLNFALEEIRKAEIEVEKLTDSEEVKKAIRMTDYGDIEIPIAAFRPLIRKAIIAAFDSVNWEKFISWHQLFHEIEGFIIERVQVKNEEDEHEI